jgi:hypothetical protein
LCDIVPLEVFDVLLGQPFMWKHHVVYESQPKNVIITLGKRLYKIPEVAPKAYISLISAMIFFLQAVKMAILENQSTTTKTQSFPCFMDGRLNM